MIRAYRAGDRIISVMQVLGALVLVWGVHAVAQDARYSSEESRVLQNEHRLTVIEAQVTGINDRLSRIETLGYGVVGASLLQLFDLLVLRRKKP